MDTVIIRKFHNICIDCVLWPLLKASIVRSSMILYVDETNHVDANIHVVHNTRTQLQEQTISWN